MVVVTMCTLAVLEGGTSAYLFAHDYLTASPSTTMVRPHTMNDTLLGWVNRPSFSSPNEYGLGIGLTTTAEGFRGTGSAIAIDPTRQMRVVCSGDSFTLGSGVADNHHWCGLLERYLPGLQTINMGQGSYGLDQAFLWYIRDGARIPHQIHLLALTDGEFERSLSGGNFSGRPRPYLALEGGTLATKNVPVPPQSDEALKRASKQRVLEELRIVRAFRAIPAFDHRLQLIRGVDDNWPLFEKLFDALVVANRERGSQLVLAYLPGQRDIKPNHLDRRRDKLAAYSRKHDIAFLDLTPPLRALRPDSIDLAFISRVPSGAPPGLVGQYSDLGHAWVARTMAAQLAALPVMAASFHR